MTGQVIEGDWRGCYDGGWADLIVPEAFAHPAKFSRALIARIYEHARAEGWLEPGDVVLDPFGGVALGGLDAMRLGLNWMGCELEPKFVALGGENIALWNRRYSHVPGWGTARLLQGDSRKLAEVVAGAGVTISSPPFGAAQTGGGIMRDGYQSQLRPDLPPDWIAKRTYAEDVAGSDPANLGNLPATPRGLAMALASPPFQGAHDGAVDAASMIPPHAGLSMTAGYGSTPGQLGAMPAGTPPGDPAAVIASPPYEDAIQRGKSGIDYSKRRGKGWRQGGNEQASARHQDAIAEGYGEAEGQLGGADDFWSASRVILEQVYAVLRPGGKAIFVTKDFVRAKTRVPFSDQWQALCEAVGFRLVCAHRAMLVTDQGEQRDAFGQHKALKRERKSFFRRLAEAKGSPRIDHEDVRCFVK